MDDVVSDPSCPMPGRKRITREIQPEDAGFWEQALAGLPLCIAMLQAKTGRTRWANPALQELVADGVGVTDLIGLTPHEYLPNLQHFLWKEFVERLDALPIEHPPAKQRLQFVDHKTRNIAYWEWSLQRLKTAPDILLLTVQEVSEVVMSERLLATAGRTADRARRRAEALVRMTELVNASRTTPDLLEAVTLEAAGYFDTPHAAILLLDAEEQRLEVGFCIGIQRDEDGATLCLDRENTLAGRALAQHRSLVSSDPSGRQMRTLPLEDGTHPATLVSSPIYQEGRAYGVIEVYFKQSRDIPDEALSLMTAYADQMAIALLKADLHEKIEEQRRQLQSIFDHASVAILYFDPKGRVVAANRAAAIWCDLPVEEMIGRSYEQFLHGLPPGLFDRVRQGQPFRASHYIYPHPHGTDEVCDLSLLPIQDGSGEVAGLLLLSFDVTELVTARQEADAARRSAEDALAEVRATQSQMVQVEKMRALGELASGVAHDFNNALMAILGYTELAEEETDDPAKIAENLAIIRRAAEDAASTVQRLQRLAKHRVTMHGTLTDLRAVVEDVVTLTRPFWRDAAQKEGKFFQVHTELEPVEPVLAEPSGLREVLINMIQNALNAMPQGGVLTLSTHQLSDREVMVEVADTGAGMTPEVLARVFDPFFTTRGVEGTGLGLAVSWTIIQRHGGVIEVDSEEGKGTRFRIKLPVGKPEEATRPPQTVKPSMVLPDITVLVVDDEPIVASVVSSILSRHGYRTVVAHNAKEALALLQEDPALYRLVLTDHGMPGMNGLQLIAEIKRVRPDLPTLLLTGWGETVLQGHVSGPMPEVVLGKPINQSDLLNAIEQVLNSHEGGSAESNPIERNEGEK